MQVTIDPHSGFCFGVVHAIEAAERELQDNSTLYCLGDIVHNHLEVERLKNRGMVTISHEDIKTLHDCKVLIRAHGEPPETYETALRNRIVLIDATCPVVLTLQNSIHRGYMEMKKNNGQVVIYGKEGHAEVNALKGQTGGTAIVTGGENDLKQIDFTRPVRLYSQTTQSADGFKKVAKLIRERMEESATAHAVDFKSHDSVCGQVSNRVVHLAGFAAQFDLVVFVSGRNSSNGIILFQVCKDVNHRTYMVSNSAEVRREWFENIQSVGVCGATSTPLWLMEDVAGEIQKIKD
ncbi:MAG: 4-hydroxy-3-methylbut-2-enyl diphosphate reductase [bacterium]